MKKLLVSLFLAILVLTPLASYARTSDQITDWYIKDFASEIVVNRDSSLTITERIIADAGNLPDKHGIFRILPLFYSPQTGKKVKTPIELISITDFESNPYNFSTIKDSSTITWKIGDPDITVRGENDYEIKYKVKNTIRFDNSDFDEFYWNLNGNFWDIETDHFLARIIFPTEISRDNIKEINLYSGYYGAKDADLASYSWLNKNTIQVESKRDLSVREGISLSATFPKNIISSYVPTFWEKYGGMIIGFVLLLIPILVFFICLFLWLKHGKDNGVNRAVAPEFEIPDDMNPMEMSVFLDNGKLKSSAISAAIVNLAVKGYLKIEAIPKQGIFSSADTKFIRLSKKEDKLSEAEKNLLNYLFGSTTEVKLSDLRNEFYKYIPQLQDVNFTKLSDQKFFEKKGFAMRVTMFAIAGLWFAGLFFSIFAGFLFVFNIYFYIVSIPSIIILFIFGTLMPKRSKEGAELLWKIKGFKMYMKTAEKYRQKFIEKENIFEKFLPYAMLFGITGLWISKIKQIYGEEYFNTYLPAWYAGYLIASDGSFNIDSFTNELNSMTSSMAQTMSSSPSSSGSGGGGFSGGGGGGGGGGGW